MSSSHPPYERKRHTSIVSPPTSRTGKWRPNPFEPGRFPPPAPPPPRRRKKPRGPRKTGEREERVLAALTAAGRATSADLAAKLGDLDTRMVGLSLGILREHRLVTPERFGTKQIWQCVPEPSE